MPVSSESHCSKEKQKAISIKQRCLHNATIFVSDFNVFVEIPWGVGALSQSWCGAGGLRPGVDMPQQGPFTI